MTISYTRYDPRESDQEKVIQTENCDLCKNTVFLQKELLSHFTEELDGLRRIPIVFGVVYGKTYQGALISDIIAEGIITVENIIVYNLNCMILHKFNLFIVQSK